MLGRKHKILEDIIKSLSVSVSDLTSQVELLKSELRDLKDELQEINNKVDTKDLKRIKSRKV